MIEISPVRPTQTAQVLTMRLSAVRLGCLRRAGLVLENSNDLLLECNDDCQSEADVETDSASAVHPPCLERPEVQRLIMNVMFGCCT
jgi:hypothetical protein